MNTGLVVLSLEPLNAETDLARVDELITPAGRHYVRTHFPIPSPPDRIAIDGRVARAHPVSLDEVRGLGARRIVVTLECAGNGRRYLEPPVPGEQWGLGAVGTAEWTGAPLRALLERASPAPDAVEVLFRGADEGTPKDLGRRIAFERSLPMEIARRDEVVVAYAMNGAAIPPEHGGPLRLIVPGWYGMASVKWLARITLLDRPFVGFYQTDRYVIGARPLREIAPRAVITSPVDGATVKAGRVRVEGLAWSGGATVEAVVVAATGDELTVREAELGPGTSPYGWRRFTADVPLTPTGGRIELVARATDAAGARQPEEQRWNALGYANNAARPVRIQLARS